MLHSKKLYVAHASTFLRTFEPPETAAHQLAVSVEWET